MIGERYESLVAAMSHLDAAKSQLEECDFDDVSIVSDLLHIRNSLNRARLAALGNGANRPYHVSEIVGQDG